MKNFNEIIEYTKTNAIDMHGNLIKIGDIVLKHKYDHAAPHLLGYVVGFSNNNKSCLISYEDRIREYPANELFVIEKEIEKIKEIKHTCMLQYKESIPCQSYRVIFSLNYRNYKQLMKTTYKEILKYSLEHDTIYECDGKYFRDRTLFDEIQISQFTYIAGDTMIRYRDLGKIQYENIKQLVKNNKEVFEEFFERTKCRISNLN